MCRSLYPRPSKYFSYPERFVGINFLLFVFIHAPFWSAKFSQAIPAAKKQSLTFKALGVETIVLRDFISTSGLAFTEARPEFFAQIRFYVRLFKVSDSASSAFCFNQRATCLVKA